MEKQLFLGDEAIAQAAIDAGISGVYAYPGTRVYTRLGSSERTGNTQPLEYE